MNGLVTCAQGSDKHGSYRCLGQMKKLKSNDGGEKREKKQKIEPISRKVNEGDQKQHWTIFGESNEGDEIKKISYLATKKQAKNT